MKGKKVETARENHSCEGIQATMTIQTRMKNSNSIKHQIGMSERGKKREHPIPIPLPFRSLRFLRDTSLMKLNSSTNDGSINAFFRVQKYIISRKAAGQQAKTASNA